MKCDERTRTTTHMIEVERNGEWVNVNPEELTNEELCRCLSYIQIESDEFLPQKEIDEGYAAINEALRRLSNADDGKTES
jgi:hypothetical protein